jgi:diguanylate cyclase (GGDEF)-like protein/PAS domain S-box-containing protein
MARVPHNEEWFRSVIQNVSDIITLGDADGIILYDSPAVEKVLGYKPEERIGTNVFDYINPEEMVRVTEFGNWLLAHPGDHMTVEHRVRHKDGSWPLMEVTSTNLLDNPSVRGIVVNWREITERKVAEETLRASEERFRLLAENATDVIYYYSFFPTPRFEYVSPSTIAVTGYTPENYYADPELLLNMVHPEDRHLFEEAMQPSRAFVKSPPTLRLRHKDGRVIWAETRQKPIYDSEGSVVAVEGIARDITERKRAEDVLKESEKFVLQLLENFPNGSVNVYDTDLRYMFAEGKGLEQEGMSPQVLVGKTIDELFDKPSADFVRPYYQRAFSGETVEFELALGEQVYSINAAPLHIQQGKVLSVIAVAQNVTERKRLERQLQYQAYHDSLSGLPNRHLFLDYLEQALKRAERREGKVAVLLMDMDNFKLVNDSLGHEAGDQLLVAVCRRLQSCLRTEDILARFGGDEFVLLMEDITYPEDVARITNRIAEELRKPFEIDGREVFTAISIGIALSTSGQDMPEELLRNADMAMYQAKAEGTFKYRVFEPSMHEQILKRLEMENDLRQALEREEFRVYYQPKIQLQSGKVANLEALVRWEHPERGLITPSEFIPFAEETGLIVPLGRWVLEEACKQAKRWQDEYTLDAPLAMSVNLSVKQLQHPEVVQDIERVLQECGLERNSLILDITETVLIEAALDDATSLDQLKNLGIRISIDDFGMEYSSLSYLKRLPADILKIDQSFISGIGEEESDEKLVVMIIKLAHMMGLEVVGEGVETEEQAEWLREMGCDRGQGYYFARPLPPEDVSVFLKKNLSL